MKCKQGGLRAASSYISTHLNTVSPSDTGSESEYSVVRRSGNKRKNRSPRESVTAKRSRRALSSSSSSESDSDDAAPASARQPNPLSLEQRISDAPGQRGPSVAPLRGPSVAPLRGPHPPSAPTSSSALRSLPPVFHTASTAHGGPAGRRDLPEPFDTAGSRAEHSSASVREEERGRQPYPAAGASREPATASSSRPAPAPSARGGDGSHTSRLDGPDQRGGDRGYVGGSGGRGRGGSRGRGGGAGGRHGKGRADNTINDLPPPFSSEPTEAWVEAGPVSWGNRSREVFTNFCRHIDSDGFGPAPLPAFVTKPDHEGYARAKFVGGEYRTARENAQALMHAWNTWAHVTGKTASAVGLVD
ncbi:hypothetical protein C8F04DRAFT_331373 [Mycena alexandri]|uniref:Uncharacterized protein n=1 Tax=Mycena alexandri TaxID=1745969 RepID=A0AAD6T3Q3_9AGAR|nr:hypothetical protein C8F04DRAFT_331373 [Mycena alexandri]